MLTNCPGFLTRVINYATQVFILLESVLFLEHFNERVISLDIVSVETIALAWILFQF